MKIEKKVLDMSLAGIFTAIIIAMSVVPFLGYIPLGFMNATIIHVQSSKIVLSFPSDFGVFLQRTQFIVFFLSAPGAHLVMWLFTCFPLIIINLSPNRG